MWLLLFRRVLPDGFVSMPPLFLHLEQNQSEKERGERFVIVLFV